MTASTEPIAAGPAVPTRFNADPEWAKGSSKGMRGLVGPAPDPTQAELDKIAHGLTTCDELGEALAEAIANGKTNLKEFRHVLANGLDAESPEPLRVFFSHLQQRPDWVDDDLLAEGARVMRQAGTDMADVLGSALLNGYRSSADTLLLSSTGGLANGSARRVGETMKWNVECVREGGMERAGEGWKLTVHVRLMHALINRHYRRRDDWDFSVHGMPINQADQGATLGLNSTYYLVGIRLLGMPLRRRDGDAVMHLWRYIGWLIGVDNHWLPLDERDGRRKFYHLSLTAPAPDELSKGLAAAFEKSREKLAYPRFENLHRRYEAAKNRSLFTVLVGRSGMRDDLGLATSWPWYVLVRIPVNLVKHGLFARLPGGRNFLLKRGQKQLDMALARHFPGEAIAIGEHTHAPK